MLEIKCADNTGLDDDNLCLKPVRPGAELAFQVNQTMQKVLMTIVKNDGNWGVKDLFLDNCTVVDDLNWRCRNGSGIIQEYAMVRGRYYRSLTGGVPPNFYTSGIKGVAFLDVYYGFMDLPTALTMTGYSTQALNGFCATANFNYALWEGKPCKK